MTAASISAFLLHGKDKMMMLMLPESLSVRGKALAKWEEAVTT